MRARKSCCDISIPWIYLALLQKKCVTLHQRVHRLCSLYSLYPHHSLARKQKVEVYTHMYIGIYALLHMFPLVQVWWNKYVHHGMHSS